MKSKHLIFAFLFNFTLHAQDALIINSPNEAHTALDIIADEDNFYLLCTRFVFTPPYPTGAGFLPMIGSSIFKIDSSLQVVEDTFLGNGMANIYYPAKFFTAHNGNLFLPYTRRYPYASFCGPDSTLAYNSTRFGFGLLNGENLAIERNEIDTADIYCQINAVNAVVQTGDSVLVFGSRSYDNSSTANQLEHFLKVITPEGNISQEKYFDFDPAVGFPHAFGVPQKKLMVIKGERLFIRGTIRINGSNKTIIYKSNLQGELLDSTVLEGLATSMQPALDGNLIINLGEWLQGKFNSRILKLNDDFDIIHTRSFSTDYSFEEFIELQDEKIMALGYNPGNRDYYLHVFNKEDKLIGQLNLLQDPSYVYERIKLTPKGKLMLIGTIYIPPSESSIGNPFYKPFIMRFDTSGFDPVSTKLLLEKNGSVEAYPNPVSDNLYFSIEGVQESNLTIKVFDLSGRVIFIKEDIETGETYSIYCKDWTVGQYFLKVESQNSGLISEKIIKIN